MALRRMHRPDEATSTVQTTEAMYEVRPSMGGLAARMVLTIAGAAGLVIGGLMPWFRPLRLDGTDLGYRVFYSFGERAASDSVFASAGFAMILLGAAAVIGLAFATGWLTRLAGALGVVGIGLFLVTLYRAPDVALPEAVGFGAWIVLAGGIVTLIGGFMGTARMAAVPAEVVVREPHMHADEGTAIVPRERECHVVPAAAGAWHVLGPGPDRSPDRFDHRDAAIDWARELLASTGGGDLVIHERLDDQGSRQHVEAA
jgi:hypothetical protein